MELSGPDLAERLGRAIRFQTISEEDPARFRGEAFLDLHDYLKEAFPLVHASMEREIVGGYSLLYTWKGSDRTLSPILLLAHLDVVPADTGPESGWTVPPFEGRVADGYIWGRGALDDKQCAMGLLEAAELLLKQGHVPERTVSMAFGHDEEIGGFHGAARIAELLGSRGAEFEYVIDEGLTITQGIVPNVSRPAALVGTAEKGYLSVELTVEGTGGHSSMPPPETSIGMLCSAVRRLERRRFPARMGVSARGMFEALSSEVPAALKMVYKNLWLFKPLVMKKLAAEPAGNSLIRTTAAATVIGGGVKENVLPGRARAVVNLRILAGDTMASVVDQIVRVIDDPRIRVRMIEPCRSDPSPASDTGSPAFRILERTIRQMFPEVAVAPSLCVGMTDSRHYAGMTKSIFRFLPMILGRDDLARIHGVDERISIEGYTRFVGYYAQLIRNSCVAEP